MDTLLKLKACAFDGLACAKTTSANKSTLSAACRSLVKVPPARAARPNRSQHSILPVFIFLHPLRSGNAEPCQNGKRPASRRRYGVCVLRIKDGSRSGRRASERPDEAAQTECECNGAKIEHPIEIQTIKQRKAARSCLYMLHLDPHSPKTIIHLYQYWEIMSRIGPSRSVLFLPRGQNRSLKSANSISAPIRARPIPAIIRFSARRCPTAACRAPPRRRGTRGARHREPGSGNRLSKPDRRATGRR